MATPTPLKAYTAIAGGYDILRHTGRDPDDPRFVCFSDSAYLPGRVPPYRYLGWEIRPIAWGHPGHALHALSPRMRAKRHQIMPHLDFPEADYSLYMDGTHVPVAGYRLERLAEVFLRDTDLATFVNPHRQCAYVEAAACIASGLDATDVIRQQMRRYRAEGFPRDHGLAGITMLLRRHTPAVRAFNELWWEEVQRGSTRDQLSFPYVAWKLGLEWTPIPGHCYYSSLFTYVPHGELTAEDGITPEDVKREHDGHVVESVALDRSLAETVAELLA